MRTFLSTVILVLLTGCVTAQNTAGIPDSVARRDYLRYAGSSGPVYLRVMTWPLRLGEQPDVGDAMAAAATGAVLGLPTAFTADPGAAPQPQFRIVATFDYPPPLSPSALCAADQADRGPAVSADGSETSLLLAFCTRGELLAGTRVRGPWIGNTNDPEFRQMVRSGIREMFSFDDPRYDNPRLVGGFGYGHHYGVRHHHGFPHHHHRGRSAVFGFGTGW